MSIYINKNNRQSGPFDEAQVAEMLKTGQFSPNDQAIRQGENQWRTLGDLFPNAAVSGIQNAAQFSNQAAAVPEKKGCRGTFGTLALVLGVLLFVGGLIPFALSFAAPTGVSCKMADEQAKKMKEDLGKEQTAENTRNMEIDRAILEESGKLCNQYLSTFHLVQIIFVVAAVVGLITAVIGFFVRR